MSTTGMADALTPATSGFADMLGKQAPGSTCRLFSMGDGEPVVLASRSALAHDFHNPGTPHLAVMAVPYYRLSQALFDIGDGWTDHFCPEPQPLHLLPHDVSYRWTVNGPSMCVMLAVPMLKVQDALAELELADPLARMESSMASGFVEPLVYESILRLWAIARHGGACPPLLLQSHVTCILHSLATRKIAGAAPYTSARSHPRLARSQLDAVIDLIHSRLGEDLSLGELAAACRLSRYHFVRVFREATGHTPYQYVLLRRIERARALLLNTVRGVADIAAEVGFTDAAHFSRSFSRHIGVSPQRYRKSQR